MQCEEFERRVNRLLDERRDARSDDALVAHAQHCDRCGQTLRLQRALFASLAQPLPIEPAVDLAARAVAEHLGVHANQALRTRSIHVRRAGRRPWRTGAMLWSTVAAAALAVAVVAPWALNQNSPDDPSRGVAADPAEKSDVNPEDGAVDRLVGVEIDPHEQLVRDWSDSAGRLLVQLPGVNGRPVAPIIDEQLDQVKPLRPLRDSLAAPFYAVVTSAIPRNVQPTDDPSL